MLTASPTISRIDKTSPRTGELMMDLNRLPDIGKLAGAFCTLIDVE